MCLLSRGCIVNVDFRIHSTKILLDNLAFVKLLFSSKDQTVSPLFSGALTRGAGIGFAKRPVMYMKQMPIFIAVTTVYSAACHKVASYNVFDQGKLTSYQSCKDIVNTKSTISSNNILHHQPD